MAEAEDRIRMCLARVERCHARAVSTPHETAKKELLLIEAEWRTLAREIKDIERSRVQNPPSGYDADFPLDGFRRAHRVLRQICLGERRPR
jgi:hypothetical protein